MEPASTAVGAKLTEAGIGVLKKESDSFLGAVLGEPAKAFGGLLADKINARRHRNLITITVRAKRSLAEAGVSPKEVPLKIIHPALEAASLEDEHDLQTAWSNLLANAADPRKLAPVSAVFPMILKELSVRDVKFLDALYSDLVEKAREKGKLPSEYNPSYSEAALRQVYEVAGLARYASFSSIPTYDSRAAEDFRNFSYTMAMLKRHNLIDQTIWPRTLDTYDAIKNPKPSNIEIELEVEYCLTEIGLCFVAACRQPRVIPVN